MNENEKCENTISVCILFRFAFDCSAKIPSDWIDDVSVLLIQVLLSLKLKALRPARAHQLDALNLNI